MGTRRKCRFSNICIVLILILIFTSIYIKFYDAQYSTQFFVKLQENILHNTSSNDYLNVRLNLTSNTAICQLNDILILYILSTANNFDRRKIIRSTWASPLIGTCFVFILGKTQDSTSSTQSHIDHEKRQYKDIVQIDHVESYGNVVYKEIAALHWSLHFYPSIPYLFKTDDDLIVDSLLISSIGQLMTTNNRNGSSYISKYRPTLASAVVSIDRSTLFRGAWAMGYQTTLRGGKFGVSEYVWPHPVLPHYCSGFGWFMSKNVRNKLVTASYTYLVNKTAWVGDVFVSGFLAKAAGVKCDSISIDYDQTFSGNCSCFMAERPLLAVCSSTLHGGGGGNESAKFGEYEKAWKVIRQRHNSTHSNNKTTFDIKDC
ncbi:unnamed protein product [Adineta steineri]|uniref:Hexosyltransferase n=1 Tax=Adineta steineri TaxID=433720 RepID=A0A819E058_9BILA|nr:unnamed protein product [Adineta steineri]